MKILTVVSVLVAAFSNVNLANLRDLIGQIFTTSGRVTFDTSQFSTVPWGLWGRSFRSFLSYQKPNILLMNDGRGTHYN